MKPTIFIGSSFEGKKYAEALEKGLLDIGVCHRWDKGVFEVSGNFQKSLINGIRDADFVIIILTADDSTHSRDKDYLSPRDNLVFESGLGFGIVGAERTFLIPEKPDKNKEVKIPSDLLGFTFTRSIDVSLESSEAIKGALFQIKERIEELGCKSVYRIRTNKQILEKASIELIESADRYIVMFGRDLSWANTYKESLEKKISDGIKVEVFAEKPASPGARESAELLRNIGVDMHYSDKDHGIKLTLIDHHDQNCSRFLLAFKERANIGARKQFIYHCEIHNAKESWVMWNSFLRLYESLKG